MLKQKNLEKKEEDQVLLERKKTEKAKCSESSFEPNTPIPDSKEFKRQDSSLLQYATPVASLFKESTMKSFASLKSQSHFPLLLVITFAVILVMMQLSIVVLLTRPQQVHVISQVDYMNRMGSGLNERSSEALAWMEKRMLHLKDEMFMVETRLEKMRHEHVFLKSQMKDLELLIKQIETKR